MNSFDGLKAGMLCAGIVIDVFLAMFRHLLRTVFEDETPETAQVDVLPADHRLADLLHHLFYYGGDRHGFDAGLCGDCFYQFCFCHG